MRARREAPWALLGRDPSVASEAQGVGRIRRRQAGQGGGVVILRVGFRMRVEILRVGCGYGHEGHLSWVGGRGLLGVGHGLAGVGGQRQGCEVGGVVHRGLVWGGRGGGGGRQRSPHEAEGFLLPPWYAALAEERVRVSGNV